LTEIKDTYSTIEQPFKGELFKDRGSKFYGYAFPISSEDQVKAHLEILRKEHHAARHWCYAWQLGVEKIRYRVNDDGEPNNSAGQPIYGRILAFEVTDILLVVVRYFGGTKLGVGGLINAYRTGAQLALENAEIIHKHISLTYQLTFDYPLMNKVMRVVKEQQLIIEHQTLELNCTYIIPFRRKDAKRIEGIFKGIYGLSVEALEG
jgi:uncharacterized YigZ family protein